MIGFDHTVEAVRSYEDRKFRKSDFVTIGRDVLADAEVKASLQTKFGFDESGRDDVIREMMGPRAGVFKPEPSKRPTPGEALDKCRARVTAEHPIRPLKRDRRAV